MCARLALVNDVTSASPPAPGYHHGDLPNVLRASAVDVIMTGGLHGFSLREVARRAGVSHAAPGYHFGDVRGLLTAVAIEGFETLRDELIRAGADIDDPIERLTAIGRGYVRVAIEHPAHCVVMFRDDVVAVDDPRLAEVGLAAYGVLEAAVAALAERHNPALHVPDAARLCWSAMQGLVELHAKFEVLDTLHARAPSSLDDHVERFTTLIVNGLVCEPGAPRSGRRPR
jgi:AcrR family transcriptional regulator